MNNKKYMKLIMLLSSLIFAWVVYDGYLLFTLAENTESVICKLNQLSRYAAEKEEPFEPGTMLKYIESEKSLVKTHVKTHYSASAQFFLVGVALFAVMILQFILLKRLSHRNETKA